MKSPHTRREALISMAALGAVAAPPRLFSGHVFPPSGQKSRSTLDPDTIIDGTDVRALAMRALDAAKVAGATYADVRLTRQLTQQVAHIMLRGESELVGVGVRVRVGGAWGFAASPYWDPDEVVLLAQTATAQAKSNARASAPPDTWTPIPVALGSWATPVKVDPFTVPVEEKVDLLRAWVNMAARYRGCDRDGMSEASFTRTEYAVATSDGAYVTQVLYQTGGRYQLTRYATSGRQRPSRQAEARELQQTAAGWEIFAEADIPGQLPALYEAADPSQPGLPFKPGDIGQYDVVFDAATMGSLLERTIGTAAQVDRVLGYEANASGTSYLGTDPLAALGMYRAASSLVSVTANRSMPRGVGTVKWDNEGVAPDEFTLVKDGVLVDYQTTREQAGWLAPYYQKAGRPVRSHGCAAAQDATFITIQHTPNLVLEPAAHDASFDDLVADTPSGLAVMGGVVAVDFQGRNGAGAGTVREIVNGKLGSVVGGLGFLFSTTPLWKSIVALGGPNSMLQYASSAAKGQPAQNSPYSVRAVPAKATKVDFVNPSRKA